MKMIAKMGTLKAAYYFYIQGKPIDSEYIRLIFAFLKPTGIYRRLLIKYRLRNIRRYRNEI